MTEKSNTLWYPRYPGDYQRKTSHLTLIEHGVYAVLLDHYYATGQPLPANAKQVQRICRAFDDDEISAMHEVLKSFFVKRETGYHNQRADDELRRRLEITDKRRSAAKSRHTGRSKRTASAPANVGASGAANAHTVTVTSIEESSIEDSLGNSAALFETWWEAFPRQRRGSKQSASKSWKRVIAKGVAPQAIMAGLAPYLTSRDVADGYACAGDVWLNKERWNDQPPQAGTNNASNRRTGPNVSEQADALLYRKYGLDKPTDAGADRTDQFIPGTVLDA